MPSLFLYFPAAIVSFLVRLFLLSYLFTLVFPGNDCPFHEAGLTQLPRGVAFFFAYALFFTFHIEPLANVHL